MRCTEHHRLARVGSRPALRSAPVDVGVEAHTALRGYDWPGNIRELANVIERAVLLCDGPEILPHHLPPELAAGGERDPATPDGSLWGNERAMIVRALREAHWNQSAAARALGISRDNLRYRIKKYDITRE